MSTEVVKVEQKAVVAYGSKGVQIDTLEGMYRFAQYVVASGFAPRGFEKPESVLIAIQSGAELGLSPMQSLQSIAIINGRAGIYGDAALALVRGSGLCASYSQKMEGEGDNRKAVVVSKRKDGCEIESTFSVSEAKKAGLWGKSGPWSQYPERMLMFRARGFNLRDNFGDVLKGFKTTEELQDYPIRDNYQASESAKSQWKASGSLKEALKVEVVSSVQEAGNSDLTVPVEVSTELAGLLVKIDELAANCTAAKIAQAYKDVGLNFEDDPKLEFCDINVLTKLVESLEKKQKKENK